MRVLIATTPGTGHIHPLVPVARALQARGHDVMWATASSACAMVQRLGFETAPAGMDLGPRQRAVVERWPEIRALPPRQRRPAMFTAHFASLAAPVMAADLGPLLDRWSPDLVVHEPGELAAAPLARARGLPHVTVGFGGLLPAAVLDAASPTLRMLWEDAAGSVPPDLGLYDHLYLHPFPPLLDPRPGPATVRRVRPVGVAEAVNPAWTATLAPFGRDRPGVYLTFGTEFAPLAPWQPLLEVLGGADVDVLATVGADLPVEVGGVPANVRVERWVPQDAVLAKASAVIDHGGAGSLLGAASRGLPQLCVPIAADQFDNADALAAAGAGLVVEADDADPATLGEAVTRLLSDGGIAAAAQRLAGQLAAMPDADAAAGEVVAVASRD